MLPGTALSAMTGLLSREVEVYTVQAVCVHEKGGLQLLAIITVDLLDRAKELDAMQTPEQFRRRHGT